MSRRDFEWDRNSDKYWNDTHEYEHSEEDEGNDVGREDEEDEENDEGQGTTLSTQ